MLNLILYSLLSFFVAAGPAIHNNDLCSDEQVSICIAVFRVFIEEIESRFSNKNPYLLGVGRGLDSSPVSDAILDGLADMNANIKAFPEYPYYMTLGMTEENPFQLLCITSITKENDDLVYVLCARWQIPQRNNMAAYRYTVEKTNDTWQVTDIKLVAVS